MPDSACDGWGAKAADAILGAGIMSGASPKDFKDMRRKGAQFFYNQQDQLKRIYDIVTDGNQKDWCGVRGCVLG